jgi:hypothetical protein
MNWLKLVLLSLSFLGYCNSYSQEVLSSGGEFNGTSDISLSSTIGEPITETFISSGYILTQGFQQTRLLVVEIEEENLSKLSITVYPNPTSFNICIKVENFENEKMRYKLFDIEGTLLADKQIQALVTKIDLTKFTRAAYILEIFADQNKIKSFKVIKQ